LTAFLNSLPGNPAGPGSRSFIILAALQQHPYDKLSIRKRLHRVDRSSVNAIVADIIGNDMPGSYEMALLGDPKTCPD
jgi:hypothetical protein